LTQP